MGIYTYRAMDEIIMHSRAQHGHCSVVLMSVADAMMSLVSYYGPLPSSSAWVLILRARMSDFGHELSSKTLLKPRPDLLK